MFPAVTSIFIVGVQNKLEPDCQKVTTRYYSLKIVANALLGNISDRCQCRVRGGQPGYYEVHPRGRPAH